MIRVLIVDDHPIIRRGLRDILSESSEFEVIGEAASAAEALAAVRRDTPAIVLMDITMPGRTGLEALADMKAEFPNLPVLMLSIHPEEHYAVRALKAGASGYLTKESAPEELIDAIHKAVAGGKYVTASLAERLAQEVGTPAGAPGLPHERLSNREFDVLVALGRGQTVSQIADDMSLSVKTVSTYRTRILEKLNLKTTAEVIKYALEHGLEK